MRFFNFTNKKTKTEEQNNMAKIDELLSNLTDEERKELRNRLKDDTSDQIKEAKEDIAEKGGDSQTEKDRIDESVAAQERAEGTRDSQDAKDRVDEAEGEDKALERKDDAYDARADIAALRKELGELKALVSEANSKPREVTDDKSREELNKAKQLYLN